MKKLLFFFALNMSILISLQAGYLIRGVSAPNAPENFRNFTLTLNSQDRAFSASSGIYNGNNCIVIVQASNQVVYYFPVTINNINYPVQVRDFHFIGNDTYILCGAIRDGISSRAFVAKIYGGFTSMDFNIHPEADIYYSIWTGTFPPSPGALQLRYYACGAKGDLGVLSFINRSTLVLERIYETNRPWVYHKVIAKQGDFSTVNVIASGRNIACDSIGLTVYDIQSGTSRNYAWRQRTEYDSHSVLCDYLHLPANSVVVASSYQTTLTLNPIIYPIPVLTPIQAYRYSFFGTPETKYCVQDVRMYEYNDVVRNSIFVAGYITGSSLGQTTAWFGSVSGLYPTSRIRNYSYFGNGMYQHYKIGFSTNNVVYTGGYFQGASSRGTLFGTPLRYAEHCDHNVEYPINNIEDIHWVYFGLIPKIILERPTYGLPYNWNTMGVLEDCLPFPFKGGDDAPEFATLPPAKESEIINYSDRITVKDVPANTLYQIYSVTGQLIQTGSTTPDISTAQLSKGMYILRLENGKAFKFVK